jgi:hypothetical protein
MGGNKTTNPNTQPGGTGSPGQAPACPPTEYELVELLEVVSQNREKWVKGCAMDHIDKVLLSKSVERNEKDGDAFKQFINLDPDLESQAKRQIGRAHV